MKTRDAIALAVVAAVLMTAGAWFTLIKPQRAESTRLDAEITTQEQALGEAQTQVAANLAARAAYPENYATVARLGKALPASADTASLIEQLADTSRRTGVSFTSVTSGGEGGDPADAPAPAEGAAPAVPGATAPEARPFSFAFDGSFLRLSTFLDRFERYVRTEDERIEVDGRLMTIDAFQLAPEGEGDSVQATITATSYVVEDLLGGATPEAPVPGESVSTAVADAGTTPPVPPTASIGATP